VSTVRSWRLAQFIRAAWYRKSTARDQTALAMRIRDLASNAQIPQREISKRIRTRVMTRTRELNEETTTSSAAVAEPLQSEPRVPSDGHY